MKLLSRLIFLCLMLSSVYGASYEVTGDASSYYSQIELDIESVTEEASYKGDTVSILSKEQADQLFAEFSMIPYMMFDYLHDGCFARAHEFALIAMANSIEMGKVFLTDKEDVASLYPQEWINNSSAPIPYGFVGWRYHVAPYVLVKVKGKLIPYVFDIGVSNNPKSVEKWISSLIKDEQGATLVFSDRAYMFEGSSYPVGDVSNIAGQIRDQELIRELGISEYLFQLEQGWL